MRQTRRHVMWLAAAAVASGGAIPAIATQTDDADLTDRDLAGLLNDCRAAEAIGRAFLAGLSAPRPSLVWLRAEVTEALQPEHPALRRMPAAVRLRRRIRHDFTAGNVVVVDGWMLSKVEAQVCAIACITAAEGA